MGTVRWSGTARTAFGDLSQGNLLKPTALWGLMAPVINEFWPNATGRPGNDFLAATDCRTLLMHLVIERRAVPVPDEHDVVVEIVTPLGAQRPGGRAPRYGGIDQVRFIDPERPAGDQVVATWKGWWLWFRAGEHGSMRLLDQPAPGVALEQDDTLEEPERPPRLDAAEPGSRFRWTSRETDTNDHVFSLSFVERAENALADRGVDTGQVHRWQTWWLRPAFLGEAMLPQVEERDGEWLIALRNLERDEVSAVVRAG